MPEIIDRLAGALAGRYDVERQIGRGGMATVYLARDVRHERSVAIKVLNPEIAASIGGDRFLREIKVAASLQHPHILGFYESGEADGLLYYVMPYVEGESLRDRLDREKQLPIDEAVRIACESASALDYAHRHGVIHRDVKPENILLADGHAIVADFGIARAVTVAGGDKLTQTGMTVGTPLYMSPEQAMGGDSVSGQSDVYSLGCVLYETLTGSPPFSGPNPMAIFARHTLEAVPSMQIVRRTIPDEVEDAVLCALNKTPADRFPSAAAFERALSGAAATTTAHRVAGRATTRVMRSQERRQGMVVGGVVAVALLVGGGWWSTHRAKAPAVALGGPDASKIAVAYFDDVTKRHDRGYLADGLTEALIDALSPVAGLQVVSKGGVLPFRGDSVSADSIGRALGVGTVVTGQVDEPTAGSYVARVQLRDAATGQPVDGGTATVPLPANLLAARDSVAAEVALLVRQRVGKVVELRAQRSATSSDVAWTLVQRAAQAEKTAATTADSAGHAAAVASTDSLLAAAEVADPAWVTPTVQRAKLQYAESRRRGTDATYAAPYIERGLAHAERALAKDGASPDALEARGTLRYWKYLLDVDPVRGEELLTSAQKDLEAAAAVPGPAKAAAYATLSHLYYRTGNVPDAQTAARNAYAADAYLANASTVLWRVFTTSYDLESYASARAGCDDGQRRFPSDFHFVDCQIWLMSMANAEPDVPRAWALLARKDSLVPAAQRDFEDRKARMFVAAAIARAARKAGSAALRDSALRVAERARADVTLDPQRELPNIEAFVRLLADDRAGAMTQVKLWATAHPATRASEQKDVYWWFRSIADDPQYRRIVAGG